jgi:hypothetical protein
VVLLAKRGLALDGDVKRNGEGQGDGLDRDAKCGGAASDEADQHAAADEDHPKRSPAPSGLAHFGEGSASNRVEPRPFAQLHRSDEPAAGRHEWPPSSSNFRALTRREKPCCLSLRTPQEIQRKNNLLAAPCPRSDTQKLLVRQSQFSASVMNDDSRRNADTKKRRSSAALTTFQQVAYFGIEDAHERRGIPRMPSEENCP